MSATAGSATPPGTPPGTTLGLRPVRALELRGVVPGGDTVEPPHFVLAAPESLLVDESYQRSLSERSIRLIRRIVADWDWAVFKPPVVVEAEEGALHVIDGQHTAIAAASHPAIAAIPVQLVERDARADRARAFVRINRDRLGMLPGQVHRALAAAGDPAATALDRVCAAAGVRVLAGPPGKFLYAPRDTVSVRTIGALIAARGEACAQRVLAVCAAADMAPVSAAALKAVAWLLFDTVPDAPGLDPARLDSMLAAALADPMTETRMIARANAAALPQWRALGEVLRDAVAAGRRAASSMRSGEAA